MVQKVSLFLINLIFGSLVLYSYYSGLKQEPQLSLKLWGGVPEILHKFIISFMFISAVGYFIFTYNFLFKVDPSEVLFLNRFSYWSLHIIYLLILIPSALWINLTFNYMKSGNQLDWILVVSVLYCVALASIALFLFIVDTKKFSGDYLYLFSILGGSCFVFHTLFLDGLIWTVFFHKGQ